jgi:hypothetical protein
MIENREVDGYARAHKNHVAATLTIEDPASLFKGASGLATADDGEWGIEFARVRL